MTKKIGIYIACIAVGFVLSYLLFGQKSDTSKNDSQNKIANASWVCAMHPQVREKEFGVCPLCAMDLVVVNLDSSEDQLSVNQFKMTKKAMTLANIETSEVSYNNDEERVIELSGIIETNQETDATQTTAFEGRIDKLNANYVGAKIIKGRQVGVIYAPELYLGQTKLLSSISYRYTHPELFSENRNTYGLWKMTDAQIENVITSGKPIMTFPIYADVSGTVTEVIASEGKFYKEGDALLKISNLRTVWAVFDAYESQLASLKVGQTVELKSNGFPEGSISGKISFIEPLLNKDTRTASVRVVLNNKAGSLKPGMLIEAHVKSKLSKGILTVPKTATLWTGKRSVVYRKPYANRPLFEMTEVVLGQALNDSYEVLSGLEVGDNIVTEGAFTVDAVAQLQGKKSMMRNIEDENQAHDTNLNNKDIKGSIIPDVNWKVIDKNELSVLLEAYILLKDALVSSNTKLSKVEASKMLKTFKTLDIKNLSEAHKIAVDQLSVLTESIATTDVLKNQRIRFKALSELFVDMVSKSRSLDNTVYVQFCPMADDNTGANWLSLEKKIMNPYFGDKMLNCGSVLKELN